MTPEQQAKIDEQLDEELRLKLRKAAELERAGSASLAAGAVGVASAALATPAPAVATPAPAVAPALMQLRLVRVPPEMVRGEYAITRKTPNGLRLDQLFVNALLWSVFKACAPRIVIGDLCRTIASSLARMIEKPGLVQAPSWSHHHFAAAFDLNTRMTLKHGGFKTRRELDAWLAERGAPMFWIEPGADNPGTEKIPKGHPLHNAGAETYHHSMFTGEDLAWLMKPGNARSTEGSAEGWIQRHYGEWLDLRRWKQPCVTAKRMLTKLGHYHGECDDDWDAEARAALGMFQRAAQVITWCRKKGIKNYVEGQLDAATARVLAFASADRIVEEPS